MDERELVCYTDLMKNYVPTMDTSIFYNVNETLEFDALYNFLVGERGNGKGYGGKTYCTTKALESIDMINGFLEPNFLGGKPHIHQFAYMRRKGVEVEGSAPTFFEDIQEQFPEINLHFKQQKHFGVFYCDDYVIGYSFSLKALGNYKSIAFPFIDFILYDEFIVDEEKGEHYLKGEVETFKKFYLTIARPATRGYGVKVLFIGNRISDINPYFVHYNLETPNGKRGIRIFHNDMLVQLTQTVAYRKKALESRYYQMELQAGDEDFINYSVHNEALRDTNDFIRKPPKDGQYKFTMVFLNATISVYFSHSDNCYFISDRIDYNYGVRFTTEPTLHTEGCTYVKRKGTSAVFNHFLTYLHNSLVWYRNKKVKYVALRGLSHFR